MKIRTEPALHGGSQSGRDDDTATVESVDAPPTVEADEEDSAGTHTDDADCAQSPEDAGAARLGWTSRAIRGAAAAVLICAVAGAAGEAWLISRQHQKTDAAHQALTAATTFVNALTTVDTNAIDKEFGDVLGGSTGEFKDMYTKSSAQLRRVLIDNKAAAHGTVVEAAVESATTDKVVVLFFVDQSVSNQQAPDPQIDRSRVKITMEKVDHRWLASKVEMP
jgi:Mce-associated membrane protein